MRTNGVKTLIPNIMKYALLSVYNKHGIVELAKHLLKDNFHIISSDGTYKLLKSKITSDSIMSVTDFTNFPELLGGRVKTLHPRIYSGILSRRTTEDNLNQFSGKLIDVIAVNLYPFKETIAKKNHTLEDAIENIDIGGVSLIRAASKNYHHTMVLTDPEDYTLIHNNTIETRKKLAVKGFNYITNYDSDITSYLSDNTIKYREYHLDRELKYGCNPHQIGNIYHMGNPIKILNGNPGYINYLDAMSSWQLVEEASRLINLPVAASFKHTTPTGVGSSLVLSEGQKAIYNVKDLSAVGTAFVRARNADPMSSFGDFIAISHMVDIETAELIKKEVSDGIIAPSFQPEALELLKTKKNGNYIIMEGRTDDNNEYREINGIVLEQNKKEIDISNKLIGLPLITQINLILANVTLKYTPSNSVVFSYDGQVIGVGAGQQNRVDCVRLAGEKAHIWGRRLDPELLSIRWDTKKQDRINQQVQYIRNNPKTIPYHYCMASDGFFPFSDSIHEASKYNVKIITQPGGSKSDLIIDGACKSHDIKMIRTGLRLFYH